MPAHVQPQYNLSLEEAIVRLREEAQKHADEDPDPILEGVPVDTAWALGYATCLHDLESLTGPNPREVGLVILTPIEDKDPTK